MLHALGLSRIKLREIFESPEVQNLDEMELVALFGNKRTKSERVYDFMRTEGFMSKAAPLYEFGKPSLDVKGRMAIYKKLPFWVKELLPEDFKPGVYHDDAGRMYKSEDMEELYDHHIWTVAIPRTKIESLDFPETGETLTLFKKKSKTDKQNSIEFEVVDVSPINSHVQINTTLIVLKEIK